MQARILYLSYDGMTDPLGQSQVLPYLTGLSRKGYEITLISFEKPEKMAGRGQIDAIVEAAGIRWIPMTYHKSPPVLSTVYDIRKLKQKIRSLQKEQEFDIVHCRGYITAFAGEWMKKKWRTRFLFDMRGFFADERVDGKIWNRKNPLYDRIYRYFKKKEKDFFRSADHVVSLTYEGEKIIRSFSYIPPQFACTVIPCCVDLDLFRFREEKNEPPRTTAAFRICYLGSIGTWYMLGEMLDLFRIILEKYPASTFTFFTHEPRALVLEAAAVRGIPADRFVIAPAARKDLPSLLRGFDLSVFFIRPVFSKKASSPTKQGELMAMGVPVICNSGVGDTDTIVEKYNSGYVVKSFSDEEYRTVSERLEQIAALPKEPMVRGAEEYFSLEKGVNRYENIYRELSGQPVISG